MQKYGTAAPRIGTVNGSAGIIRQAMAKRPASSSKKPTAKTPSKQGRY